MLYWGEEYGEELPIYVDRFGNLCTNMYTEADEATGRVLLAFNDGIFDRTIADIDDTTSVDDYPQNVKNIASFMGEEEFGFWTANQKLVDGLDADGAACTECVPFTTYWDFLSAVAKAPGFCAGQPGPMYGRFTDEQMCAKEFSGMAAVMITQTNGWNDALVDDVTGESIPFWQQGLATTNESECDDDAGGDSTSADCLELGGDANDYDDFYADKGLDPNGEKFVPRGAGYIYGIDQYYWFSKIVYGDATITDAPSMVSTDVEAWWLSGLMRWMIPMNNMPAAHNIIIGQWEPTEAESDYGITDGFGAVSSLLYGADQCGMAGHPIAAARTEIYEMLIADIEALDGSWAAIDTVYDWESSDCAQASRAEFPSWGDYAAIPQFASPSVTSVDWDGNTFTLDAQTCFVVDERTEFIVWEKDAFRSCILGNVSAGLEAFDGGRR